MSETTSTDPNVLSENEMLQMGLLQHLNELRKRMTWAVVALVITTVISFTFAGKILDFLIAPYGGQLQIIRPTESLETFFKVSLMAGAILSMPAILFQLWRFVEPALEKKEKKYVYIFVPGATLLFLLGLAFGWLVLMPTAIFFLSNFMSDVFVTEWTSQEYISFITGFLFWLGISFQMPIIIYFLARTGLVTAKLLIEQWRISLVAISVIAAAITPTVDPLTMLLTMAPLIILYIISFGMAKIGERQFNKSMEI